MQEQPAAAYEVRQSPEAGSTGRFSPRQEAAHTIFRAVLVPSRYNVSVDLSDGRAAVYNTFSAALTILPRAEWQRILGPGARFTFLPGAVAPAISRLHASGFVIPEGTDEVEMVRQHYQRGRHDRVSGFTANVLLTMGCNLACRYCFQGQTQMETRPRMMAAETEDAVIEYLKRSAAGTKMLRVSWFGGEPLLGLRQIKRMTPALTEFCDGAGIAYRAVITTNGVLLEREAVDTLVEARLSQAQVSLDVPAELKHDKRGRCTQDRVLDNLAYAAERIPTQVRVNLTRDDVSEWDRLFDGMARRGLNKTLASVFIAHVYQPEAARGSDVGSPETPATYVEVMRRQYERAQNLGLPMERTVASRCGSGCAATSDNAVTIDPEGLLYKCPDDAGRPNRAYGSVFLDVVIKSENLLRWLSYDWFQYEACRECTLMAQCAGGCPHQRMFQPGRRNDSYCYWALRGDLEGKIRETVKHLLETADVPSKADGPLCSG